jgi:hypothetical protein
MYNAKEVGSRGYQEIANYNATCSISGVDYRLPAHCFQENYSVVLRSDLVTYAFEFLSYKMGITINNKDIVLYWNADEWMYPNTKVYRQTLFQDYESTLRILSVFEKNLMKAKETDIAHNE